MRLRTLRHMTKQDAPRAISLDPMTEEEFEAWLLPEVAGYAEEHIKSGRWAPHEALEFSKAEFRQLLPEGRETKDQFLFTIRDTATGQGVGTLWFGLRRKAGAPEAFVYGIAVHDEQQGKGYGRAAMLACIDKARELGVASVGLHVFGHNAVARSLYTSLGFVETNVNMSLSLGPDAGEAG
jgi:ribosomal protein S18 acetylase RimI-like enzyme